MVTAGLVLGVGLGSIGGVGLMLGLGVSLAVKLLQPYNKQQAQSNMVSMM